LDDLPAGANTDSPGGIYSFRNCCPTLLD